VQRVLAPDTFFIALCDPRTDALHFELAIERGDILPLHKMPLGPNTVTAWVAETRQPRLIRHWDQERDHLPAQIVQYGLDTQSALSVPLIAKDKVVGVISVQKVAPDGFSGEDLRLLSAIAAPAALALENARLHEEMRERALRDSLTGAHNHAALLDRLSAAVAQDRPVSLIMLDVDRFKAFNDQWGHQAGDVALRSLVAAIQANIKSVDTVGRWGGEEFAVVLPGARLDDAAGVAARIRDRLAATQLVDPTGRPLPTPTVSQGVAAFPSCAADAPTLVDVADRALYQAKARGRNSIVVSRDAVFLDTFPKDPVR
jgi:diguanylate cyclase (GGDEF)-like protein